jgi:pimeloyl-ACP methyl ester carboxylesterase
MTILEPLPRPAWLPASTWPYDTGSLATPVGRIAVTDTGSGPTLLFVHTGLWSFLWRDLIDRLAGDHRCVTLDAPGTGRSVRVPPERVTLAASATAVAAVIDALDLRDITLVAHDLGGPAAIAAAATYADRIAAIAAVNTFAWRPAGALFRGMLAVMGSGPIRGSDTVSGWMPAATATRFGVARHWTAVDRAAFRSAFDRPARAAIHRYFADARRADAVYAAAGAALAGPLADRPLLTVFGSRNDPLRFQPRWLSLFPHAQQEVVPRGYHFPMCDAPDSVAGWLRDWRRNAVPAERN